MIVNGQPQTFLNIADRSIQYGDGCFTTISIVNGRAEFWDKHKQRLKNACERLYIVFTQWQELNADVEGLIADKTDVVLKIIISRGEGGRGYGVQNVGPPNYILSLHTMPIHYSKWQQEGISLTLSPITLAKQPLLAGIKHLNRLEQVLIKQSLEQTNYVDALVCDTDMMLVETSIGNLFWRQGAAWYTPELNYAGVDGVMRNQVKDIIRANSPPFTSVQEVRTTINSLLKADEIFVCNCLMKVVPVTKIANSKGQSLGDFQIDQIRLVQNSLGINSVELKKLK